MDYIATKYLHLVSFIVALVSVTGCSSSTEVIGIEGSNVTLTFTFSKTDNNEFTQFIVYNSTGNKIDDWVSTKLSNKITILENATILYHITNISHQDSQEYYATWIKKDSFPTQTSNNKVRLVVIGDNTTTTVPPEPIQSSTVENFEDSRSLSAQTLVLVLVSPLLLMVTALPFLTWFLLRRRESKHKTQESVISTVQERVVAGPSQASSVVYSVLDFPQRPAPVLDATNDTHYATISYLPDNSPVWSAV